jgi:membrane protease YdiL (CAAX protease family)
MARELLVVLPGKATMKAEGWQAVASDVERNAEDRAAWWRRLQFWELLVFLFLIVPSMAFSFFAIKQGNVSFPLAANATILRDLALVALVVFFLWRNGEPLEQIGWKLRGAGKEIALGAALFVPVFLGAGLIERVARRAGLSAPSTPLPSFLKAAGWKELVLAAVLVVVVAIAEETVFRGYLVLRSRALGRGSTFAVLFSSFVFSLGHGYEGTAGVVTVGAMGAAFAVVYLWRRSLVAPIVMHFLQDFLGIVLLPLLMHKP